MPPAKTIQVRALVTTLDRVVFEGLAKSLVFPGQQGTFEVLPFHRPLVTKLIAGPVVIDGRAVAIRRGIVRVADDVVTAVVEL
jgi:F0F1-type ATP synthase epsilon subunit